MKTRAPQPTGTFVGLLTLDVEYLVDAVPARDRKTVAKRQLMAAGGPATNAAKTFAALGGRATLVTAVGGGPLGGRSLAELVTRHGVRLQDLAPPEPPPVPVSACIVLEATGERSVVSVTDSGGSLAAAGAELVDVGGSQCVLLDGFHLELAIAVAERARAHGVPVVLDGGSWKAGFERLLPLVDWAVCSASFAFPGGSPDPEEVLAGLRDAGVRGAAVTSGPRPLRWQEGERSGTVAAPVPGRVVDTLGAGDVFHGALCHGIARGKPFAAALELAAGLASSSCTRFGVDAWLSEIV